MTGIKELVTIAPRFERAMQINIPVEKVAPSLAGYVCPASVSDILQTMAKEYSAHGHSAFTITGPYGMGKSSALLLLIALLGKDKRGKTRQIVESILGRTQARELQKKFRATDRQWRVVPLIADRSAPGTAIATACKERGLIKRIPHNKTDIDKAVNALENAIQHSVRGGNNGLLLIVDELGKFLEHAALTDKDIYFWQQIAGFSAHSNGRLMVVGALHTAFDSYARTLDTTARREWAKVQGRFLDLPLDISIEEQVDLISRAIDTGQTIQGKIKNHAQVIAASITRTHGGDESNLSEKLANCWPLHPASVWMLYSVARSGFSQSQRSIFAFLNSHEPFGFQTFLKTADATAHYTLDMLWDYFQANQEFAILNSPQKRQWLLGKDCVRGANTMDDALISQVAKCVAISSLFQENISADIIENSIVGTSKEDIKKALGALKDKSFITYRKHKKAYALYEGSDFDIEAAVTRKIQDGIQLDFSQTSESVQLRPISARKHNYEKGATRWFAAAIATSQGLDKVIANYQGGPHSGLMVLVLPQKINGENPAETIYRQHDNLEDGKPLLLAVPNNYKSICQLAEEIAALEHVSKEASLKDDRIARREIEIQRGIASSKLTSEVKQAFQHSEWHVVSKAVRTKKIPGKILREKISDIMDKVYSDTPMINNELLNTQKPTAGAKSAQRKLMRAIVQNNLVSLRPSGRLPAEAGLFKTIFEASGLYALKKKEICSPEKIDKDRGNLAPLWKATRKYLQSKGGMVPLEEIYEIWQRPPYGVMKGLLPLLALTYIVTEKSRTACYIQGQFRIELDEVDAEQLATGGDIFSLRDVEPNAKSQNILKDIEAAMGSKSARKQYTPIDTARRLVATVDAMPPWTQRTMHLSPLTKKMRNIVKRAKDPNKMLFDDIGPLAKEIDEDIQKLCEKVIKEMRQFQPERMEEIKAILFDNLGVSAENTENLGKRAKSMAGKTGDMRIDGFANRLADAEFDNYLFIEDISGFVISKPIERWTDIDYEAAKIAMSECCHQFVTAEVHSAARKRRKSQHALAFISAESGSADPVMRSFTISAAQRSEAKAVSKDIENILRKKLPNKNIQLAALIESGGAILNGGTKK